MGYMEREKLLGMSEGSIYKLVNLAAKRALEIAAGRICAKKVKHKE